MKELNALIMLPLLAAILMGCGEENSIERPSEAVPPVMRWDHRQESAVWTESTLGALDTHGAALLDFVPADIDAYCPAYPKASREDRAAFWSGLLSALAKHESTWNPQASGGGGRWIGLTQISPVTARGYGCVATSVSALKNGSANLSCAVRIIAVTSPRDGVVSKGRRGVAADWAPFLNSKKESDMKAWTSSQSYCVK